jgi:hypothetical protein
MPDRRIALDARNELGPALLHHLVRRSEVDAFGLAGVRTRAWGAKEKWRLGSGGGARLALDGGEGLERVEGLDCQGSASVGIGDLPECSRRVRAAEVGLIPAPGERPAMSDGEHAVANGHAQALSTALALLAARLDLRWVTVEIQVARDSQALDAASLERGISQHLRDLAGKFSLHVGHGELDRDRLSIGANLGGAPGQHGVNEGIGDALGSPLYRGRVFEALGEVSRSTLLGQGQLALLTPKIQAIGPLASLAFDYDARDLQAARMVELAIALLDEEVSA